MKEIVHNGYYHNIEEYLHKAYEILYKYWGFKEFRPHQLLCLKYLWQHPSCFILSSTGSGKSLCYIIPALLSSGLSIVITPLISLMDDQVINLKKKGIPAERFHSGIKQEEKLKIIESIKNKRLKLLYISPERFAVFQFRKLIKEFNTISFIAIDEAHCISDWGYFRNEYENIGIYIKEFLHSKKILLTATLTQDKRDRIENILGLKNTPLVNVSSIRSNLKIKTFVFYHEEERIMNMVQILYKESGSGIIYTCTRNKVEELYDILTQKFSLNCCKFHGGMSTHNKEISFKNFMENKINIMIATKAFGMGIDKSDIRFVYHAGVPSCLEEYFQEIGRAGRDGRDSNTFLFCTPKDINIQKHMIELSYPSKKILNIFIKYLDAIYKKEQTSSLEYDFITLKLQDIFTIKDDYYIEKILDLFIKNKIYILDKINLNIGKDIKFNLNLFYKKVEEEKIKSLYKLQKMIDYINLKDKLSKDRLYLDYFKIKD